MPTKDPTDDTQGWLAEARALLAQILAKDQEQLPAGRGVVDIFVPTTSQAEGENAGPGPSPIRPPPPLHNIVTFLVCRGEPFGLSLACRRHLRTPIHTI